jgi:cell division septation protein DedD
MREPNARVRPREKFEVSLDGRQVASIVVGALVILGVVFVLGLNVGKQVAARQADLGAAGDLDALDRARSAPPVPAVKDEALTFHDRLTKAPPAPPPESAPAPAPVAQPAPPPRAAEAPAPAAPAPIPAPAPAAPAPALAPEPPPDAAPQKPWTVQLAAAQDRAEAERIATRFGALNPRIEAADVPGKGRFYRVRVGGFDTKDAAERYLKDVARETGAKGYVTPSR